MRSQLEHELITPIQDWLRATANIEIPLGLSRDDARRRVRELLATIVEDTVVTDQKEMDDVLKDVLWAAVEVLDEEPLGEPTFEKCDRFYEFVTALSVEDEPFDELDDILHCVARIGWRSARGGLEAVFKARGTIWEHGDEVRHREVCETADQIVGWIDRLEGTRVVKVSEIYDICARLFKLASIRPGVVASGSLALYSILELQGRRVGHLDDRSYLKAAVSLAAAIAERQKANWDSAESGCVRAASALRVTADLGELDRVAVEYLALQYGRSRYREVVASAPDLIQRIVVPRERMKARAVLGWAFISLERPGDARSVLEAALHDPAIESDPSYHATILIVLGNAISNLGDHSAAMARFNAAGMILARFAHPLLLGHLTSTIGESLGKVGHLRETLILYRAAREIFRQIGQAQQVGYLNVLLSEVLILLGRDEEAEKELLAVMPLIEKLDLRREALAATVLLREAKARRSTESKPIQDLHKRRKGFH